MVDTNYFKEKLVAEKTHLEEEIKSYEAKDPSFDNQNPENYDDDISKMEGHDRSEAIQSELTGRLHEVEDALKRVDEGTYGKCENCGEEISPERLEAMPTARFCASCQEKEKVA